MRTGLAAQARQAFANLGRALAAAGAGPGQVAKITICVAGHPHEHLPAIDAGRASLFAGHNPAGTVVEVETLAGPEYLIEVDAIAVIDRWRQLTILEEVFGAAADSGSGRGRVAGQPSAVPADRDVAAFEGKGLGLRTGLLSRLHYDIAGPGGRTGRVGGCHARVRRSKPAAVPGFCQLAVGGRRSG